MTCLSKSGDGFVASVCQRDPESPAIACAADDDCRATGQLCNQLVGDNPATLQCGPPGRGTKALGESCNDAGFSGSTECRSGLCDGFDVTAQQALVGMCTAACVDNADCAVGQLCSGGVYSDVGGNYCADPCNTDSDCAAGRTCQVRENRTGGGYDLVCGAPPGTSTTGTSTTDPLSCRSGLVVRDGAGGNQRCTQICTTAPNSCAGPALPVCTALDFTLPSGTGTQTINVCTAQ
jgi:hypothetical protein